MKSLFLAITMAFSGLLFAQKTCCTATQNFASLGDEQAFRMEHQLPANEVVVSATGEWREFATQDEKTGRCYVVEAQKQTNDYLLIFHEWWGLNDNIIREAEDWATKLGDVHVVAVDLYDGKIGTTREAAAELMQGADEVRIRAIIEGAAEMMGPEARIATIGWCFGGGWSMQAALQLEEKAIGCVVYYGMPEQDPNSLTALNCKVLGIFAEQDGWINREVVAKYEKAMNEAGKAYETHWFDAKHAFANPSNPVFDKQAASKANTLSEEFLKSVY